MRAAIYARYSTDLQNDRSIEDQFSLCRAHAKKLGATVVEEFQDRARSGASIIGRDGVISMMEAAKARQFDMVVVEALDRLSRDQEDLAAMYKRLTFADVLIEAVFDGRADPIQVGIRALVGQLYISDLRAKVKRGMSGLVREGRYPGGLIFGYRPVSGRPGELKIEPEEAVIVKRIFAEYTLGKSPRAIAADLNKDGIAAPRGERWTASTINGNKARGYGILQNQIYSGKLVWNRVSMIRDPQTGRRVSRPNSMEEWQFRDVPELAIVEPSVWCGATSRKAATTRTFSGGRKPTRQYLLRGLIFCGHCGGKMHIADRSAGKTRLICGTAKETGTCEHRRKVYLERIQKVAVAGVSQRLADPRYFAEYIDAYNTERMRLAREGNSRIERANLRLQRNNAAEDRLLTLYLDGGLSVARYKDRSAALGVERQTIEKEIEQLGQPFESLALHPRAIDAYKRDVKFLAERIEELTGAGNNEAAEAFSRLVSSVKTFQGEEPLRIEIEGWLSAITKDPYIDGLGVTVVAEEGLEPPTRGL
jgi:site-specific DNA recombinase